MGSEMCIRDSPHTPGDGSGFANTETLQWVEKVIPVNGDGTDRIWDALYDTIREGKAYPIPLNQALAVVEVIEKAKAGTLFAPTAK